MIKSIVIENESTPGIVVEVAQNFWMEVKHFTMILQTIVIAKYNMNNMKLHGILNNYLTQELKGTYSRKEIFDNDRLTSVYLFSACWDADSKICRGCDRSFKNLLTSEQEAFWFMER
ncbi:MAG: hypothetical protein IPG53_09800 [Ignavibacteriales bacterium]|nr:hypothetical protein [Ignavibacteriales bacterium]